MAGRLAAILAGIAIVAILLVTAFTGSGAPGTPTATISATPNPGLAQTLAINFQTQVYSFQPPNSIDDLGSHFTYSAWQTSSGGGRTNLAFQQSVAPVVTGQSGSLYTLSATVSVTTAAICSGVGCLTIGAYNITVSVQMFLSTYPTVWASPQSNITFSNQPANNNAPTLTAPSPNTYYLEFWVPLIGAIGSAFLFGALAGIRHPWVLIIGIVLLIIAALFLLVLLAAGA